MRCKLLTAAVVAIGILLTGCSTFQKVVYRPDINQGNFLTPAEVSKLQKGMTKQQVVYILGTPLMQDPFGSDTWYYVFRQQPGHQDVTQQTLTLTFNSGGTLTSINNDTSMMKQRDE
ncbi:outer membrane protein assembly factor BamE [Pragia fontium]|uniref:Outer membrane protein assembly factor BamE n=2 Tax=Pragia fontium TaxID=82985 RepID=A0AAJ5BFM0_9GAMM|nr:outer membrane protein assembly factor BamE [Pragia fontium]AKJ41567.1 membrane biogenesis protein [Pragia fontium]SFB95707.1 Beta-barrel assembly machine subunit BamE [Pragia fontium DSM 5563 = ATCC 49100]SUB81785.1 Small protein A precursor [Pragia fontium]VEJ54329.1 Small protein A precursor [Pragia fontium]GKX63084.1 outer membrane protein assembly factor BamE [Pragia fontium]